MNVLLYDKKNEDQVLLSVKLKASVPAPEQLSMGDKPI